MASKKKGKPKSGSRYVRVQLDFALEFAEPVNGVTISARELDQFIDAIWNAARQKHVEGDLVGGGVVLLDKTHPLPEQMRDVHFSVNVDMRSRNAVGELVRP